MNSAENSVRFSFSDMGLFYRILLYIPLTAIAALAIWVAIERPYTPGSDLGYNLGLVGSCMMGFLLLYPVRKHWRFLDGFGSMRAWFVLHIIFGIVGPILVLFHSTFRLNSTNATVAFWAMVIVASSGALGRFVFTQLYDGVELKKRTLRQAEKFLTECADNAKDTLEMVPAIKAELDEYNKQMFAMRDFNWRYMGAFLTIKWKGRRLTARAEREIGNALAEKARSQGWAQGRYLAERKVFGKLIADYVEAIGIAARFYHMERLLGWWQLAHVPLAYVLLLTAIIHIIAVHMY